MRDAALIRRDAAFVARLGSTRATPWLIGLLALALALGESSGRTGTLVIAPLALLAVNLLAAIATHPSFRAQRALLAFHLALLAIVALAGAGRLTYLNGRFELLEGEAFDGVLLDGERGVLHPDRLAQARFVNEGFRIAYAPGMKRGRTQNRVVWTGGNGQRRDATIGDHVPLVLAGYRFYTSPNKGFAPVFRWRTRAAPDVVGAVHLPSYPAHEHGQAAQWRLPGSATTTWIMLKLDAPILDERAAGLFRAAGAHRVVVRVGEQRFELTPGERVSLPEGELVYEELRTWMGYRVAFDPTLPWLLAAGITAVVALGLHVWQRARRVPPGDARP